MRLFFGFLIGLAIAALIAATAFKVAVGDVKDIGERDRASDKSATVEISDFDRIDAEGVFELSVEVGGDYSMTLSGRDEDLARVKATVENGVLTLGLEDRDRQAKVKLVKRSVTARIVTPVLNGVDISGVAEGDITNIDAENFRAHLSGVGELNLSGVCGTLDAEVSGVGELDAEDLKCRVVSVDVSGIGEASVYASEAVTADLGGIGRIEVSGSPSQVSKNKSGPFGSIDVR